VAEQRQIRVAVVGMSEGATCGARDHATLLAQALPSEQVSCSMHWLQRSETSLRGSVAEVRSWTRRLARELAEERPDAVVFHYSAFSFSYRGVPLFVQAVLSRLRRLQVPVVGILHEYAYPWRPGDWRGKVWAVTQRAALIDVMRTCDAGVVTADFRVDWLVSSRWLPKRPLAVAPVFSNLPAPAQLNGRDSAPSRRLGLFGYSYEGAAVSLVLQALKLLRDRGLAVDLQLLGAPGPDSPAAQAWRAGAEELGIAGALSFTGVLSPQDLSDALARCEVLLFADTPGPTSRKGTLAGSLASGSALVAIDGPSAWRKLTEAGAVLLVEASAEGLAEGVARVLADPGLRSELGASGRAFAEQEMGLGFSAKLVSRLARELLQTRAGATGSG